ncbi:MAG: right-handed parallel beta-helix repeat-containing protein [Planctomycetales bacterium]
MSPGIADGSGPGSPFASGREDRSVRRRRLPLARWSSLALALAVAAGADGAEPRVVRVDPGKSYRPLLRELRPGDELVLLPGEYEGDALLQVSGTREKPITIRGVIDGDRRPEMRLTGRRGNLWRIEANHLVIRDLAFHAARGYAIRIGRAEGIVIENCLFRDCGGGAISANSGDVNGLRISGCRFLEMPVPPNYIGHHDGKLDVRDFVFERNVIDGSKIRTSGIGYGIQLKLNVRGGVIRENFITGTQGPGIMVYGADAAKPDDASLIERNIVVGSRTCPGIVVGGGPAVVRNNLVIGCRGGGIALQNYGGRNLLDRITLVDNLALANQRHDFSVTRPVTAFVATGNRSWRAASGDGFRGLPQSAEHEGNRTIVMGDALRRLVAQSGKIVPTNASLTSVWAVPGSQSREVADARALEEMLTALSAP